MPIFSLFFFFHDPATTEIYTLSLHDALPISKVARLAGGAKDITGGYGHVGKRRYTLRFAGQYAPGELVDMVLAWRDGNPSICATWPILRCA